MADVRFEPGPSWIPATLHYTCCFPGSHPTLYLPSLLLIPNNTGPTSGCVSWWKARAQVGWGRRNKDYNHGQVKMGDAGLSCWGQKGMGVDVRKWWRSNIPDLEAKIQCPVPGMQCCLWERRDCSWHSRQKLTQGLDTVPVSSEFVERTTLSPVAN